MQNRAVTAALQYTELEVAGPYNSATNQGNYDELRATIDRIVIHTMDGTWQAAAARFDNPTQVVSAHYGVKLDGGLIHWLEEYYTAYHSGNLDMNRRSIGIEHEDGGNYNGQRPDVLYQTSGVLVADICKYYSIPCDRQHILKHSEIIATGCPDALDIDRIIREAQGVLNPPHPQPQPTPPTPPAPPPTDPCKAQNDQINAVKAVLNGKGWSWAKINKIKALLP